MFILPFRHESKCYALDEFNEYESNEFENWLKEQKEWYDYLINLKMKLENSKD